MAHLIVKIEITGKNSSLHELREEIEADRLKKESWFSKQDGDKILVDESYLKRSKADDSFFVFELVGVDK